MTTTAFLGLPLFRAFDTAGLPLAGGNLYTYLANTLTPATTWSDNVMATPNTNPVVLDTTGTATVRLDPTVAYKFVLKDASGTTQWTADYYQTEFLTPAAIGAALYPQTAAEAAAGVTPVNYAYAPGDARRYGADPTGAADSTTALQNWIACCESNSPGGTVAVLPPGNYKRTATLNFTKRCITIRGGGMLNTAITSVGVYGPILKYTTANSYWSPSFEGFQLVGDQASGFGIDTSVITGVWQMYLFRFKDILIYSGQAAIFAQNCFSGTFENIFGQSYFDHAFRVSCGPAVTWDSCYGSVAGGTQTFTGSVGGATSGTLTVAIPNGIYNFMFLDGEIRNVTVTGGTACTWSPALSAGSITTAMLNKAGYRLLGMINLLNCNGVDTAGYWGIFGQNPVDTDTFQTDFPGNWTNNFGFTGSVASAVSGTLTGAVTNGTYTVLFSNSEQRTVTVTGGTACTWIGALQPTPITTALAALNSGSNPSTDYPSVDLINCNVENPTTCGLMTHNPFRHFNYEGGTFQRAGPAVSNFLAYIRFKVGSINNIPARLNVGIVFVGNGQPAQGQLFTFTGSVGGASAGTLTGAVIPGAYLCAFSDGEQRQITVAAGGTACTWSPALSAGSITTALADGYIFADTTTFIEDNGVGFTNGGLTKSYQTTVAGLVPNNVISGISDIYSDWAKTFNAIAPKRLTLRTVYYNTGAATITGAAQNVDVTGFGKMQLTANGAASLTSAGFSTIPGGADYGRNGDLLIEALNGTLTINHTAAKTANTFFLTGAVNLTLYAGQVLRFCMSAVNGNWVQV